MNKEPQEMTNKELQSVVDEAYEQWDKDNTIFSISDFGECVRELTLRENQ